MIEGKLDGRITIRFDAERGTTIELLDNASFRPFAIVKLDSERLVRALGGLGHCPCDIEVRNLEKIGKTHENKHFEFEIPKDFKSNRHDTGSSKEDELHKIVTGILDAQGEGWVADNNYSSQNTYFTKGNKNYARVVIRRWAKQ